MGEAAEQLERRVRELEFQRNQAQIILESMMEAVVALDADGQVLWLNASAQRLLGLTGDQAAGKRLTELLRHPELSELVEEALRQRRVAARELHMFSPREQVIRIQAAPCEGGPEHAALVLVAQDVTDIRRLEAMRREFVANVSHELKTPLTSINGLVETLLDGALDDVANNRRFVTLISEEAIRLSRLIDDLLELAQIESKATPLALQPVDLRALIDSVGASLRPQLDARRVTLEVAVPPKTATVRGDPERLRQVVLNLLDNAMKFNKDGGRITVQATTEGSMVRLAVEDTGIGIPEQDLPRIFERFYRVDKARSRELGGTGLGLAIVKHLVELHGGRVEVRSRPGQGSVFTVTLPTGSSR